MIVFTIAVPADAPAWVLEWLRNTIEMLRSFLWLHGTEIIDSEITHGEDEDDPQS